jgi:penicillin-binding protein 2
MAEFTAPIEDRRSLTIRLVVLQVGCAVVFAILAFSFWYLQIVQNEKFTELAENNHQRTIALRAPRGVMLDRNGEVLVENRSSFTISIVREHTKDLDRTIRVLSEVAGLDPKVVQDTVKRHRGEPTYRPILVVDDASLAQVAAVLARQLDTELPDVQVDEVPTRQYPPESFAAHLFGYVGEASEGQVESDGLNSGAIVGQAGVEKVYNKLLMGEDGARLVKVNSMGREMAMVKEIPATSGRRVQLTIDNDLQRAAEEGFKAGGFNGAAVVMDPRTGEVLAFTSRPGYDPNDFAAGIDRATWAGLNSNPLKPLHIQDRRRRGSARRGRHRARLQGVVPRQRRVLRPSLPVLEARWPWQRRPAARDGAVVQRVLLHGRQHGRRRQDSQVGDAARPGRENRDRSAERD